VAQTPAPKVALEEAARTLAAAIIEDLLESAKLGEEEAQLQRGRARFADQVVPELHRVFDEVLSEYAI
jgi:hypothetical protein